MYVRDNSDTDSGSLTLVVSGMLWNRSLVMKDRETESLWSHLLGRAMEGELEGTVLETLPSTMVDWKTWKTDHPDTTVLALERTSREFLRSFHDDLSRFVLGLRSPGAAKAYPFPALERNRVLNDTFDGSPVVLFFRPDAAGGRAFVRRAGNRELFFQVDGEPLRFTDRETGSTWNPETGACEEGPLKGVRLEEIPAIVSFGKAWRGFYPDTEIYRSEPGTR